MADCPPTYLHRMGRRQTHCRSGIFQGKERAPAPAKGRARIHVIGSQTPSPAGLPFAAGRYVRVAVARRTLAG
ncbi:MAG: hypothetical protein MZV64_19335 [Ignavibacteriales bacterium]|nr:hypothetical protein [Ignavibacteriales bacterium]